MDRAWLPLLLVTTLLTVAPADTAPAQPEAGDLVFTQYGTTPGGVFYATWPGPMKTLCTGVELNAVKISGDNLSACVSGATDGRLYRVTASGGRTTLVSGLPKPSGQGIALDQDGSLLVTSGSTYQLLRVNGTKATVWTTLSSNYGVPNAICRDGNTGDFIVATWGAESWGYLLRVDRATGAYMVLAKINGGIYGVDWIAQTGEYVVAYHGATTKGYTAWYSSSGTLRYQVATPYVYCVNVDNPSGRVFVGTSQGTILEYSYAGSFRTSRSYGSGIAISGIDVWQDQAVTACTEANHVVRLGLEFPRSPGKSYYVALSMSPHAGIRLGQGQWINIQPDALFFLTFLGQAPYFTYQFVGTLSASGSGVAIFKMPVLPARIYATAVAINPALPNNLDIGNVEVVDTW